MWDVASGRTQCRFVSPPPAEQRHTDGDFRPRTLMTVISLPVRRERFSRFFVSAGLDASVTSIVFLKNSKLQPFSMATALVTSGAMGKCDVESLTIKDFFTVSDKAPLNVSSLPRVRGSVECAQRRKTRGQSQNCKMKENHDDCFPLL